MIRETPWTVLRGYLMGAADVVPGVSGGTIALIVGIYERLVASVRAGSSALGHVVKLDWKGAVGWLRKVEWAFVIPLAVGILLAVFTLAGLLERLLEDNPVQMAGLFMGLIAGSVIVAWPLVSRWDGTRWSTLLASSIVVFVALGLRGGVSEDTVSQATDPQLWAFFGAGAIAICAMILPGISGSFFLVLLSMYSPVLGAVNDRDVLPVLVFLLGTVVGLALFSQGLHWMLQHHHDTMMAGLIGLMAGSLRVLWPWPEGLESTALAAPDESIAATVTLAVVALGAVLAIAGYARLQQGSDATPVGAEPGA
jgi:putative membrane protein